MPKYLIFLLFILTSCNSSVDVSLFEIESNTHAPKNSQLVKVPNKIIFGSDITCILTDLTPDCWGNNGETIAPVKLFTSGDDDIYQTPTDFNLSDHNFEDMAIGTSHICGIYNSGLYCWGTNTNSSLGDGSTTPVLSPKEIVPENSGVSKVLALGSKTCAIINEGFYCWGGTANGDFFADGTSTNRSESTPFEIYSEGSDITDAAMESSQTCVVISGGLDCWGRNLNGVVGNGTTTSVKTPQTIYASGSGVTAVATNSKSTCIIKNEGLFCWGALTGDGTSNPSSTPVEVYPEGSSVKKIVGRYQSLCIEKNNAFECWGDNRYGQLGFLDTDARYAPTELFSATDNVEEIYVGTKSSCVLLQDSTIKCWGEGPIGSLDGGSFQYSTPQQVDGLESGVEKLPDFVLTADDSVFTNCAIFNSGVKCWGQDNYTIGANGSGVTGSNITPIETIPSFSNVTQMTTITGTSNGSSCAVVDGGVQCWGSNFALDPMQIIPASSGVTKLVGAQYENYWDSHWCALINGGVQCWGVNDEYQLGDGSTTNSITTPVTAIAASSGVTDIKSSLNTTCAIINGGLDRWGKDFGTSIISVYPASSGITDLMVGGYDTSSTTNCVIKNGGLFCWGANYLGEVGIGDTNNYIATPTEVFPENSGVTKVKYFAFMTCAIKNGGVYCWGRNDYSDYFTSNMSINPLLKIPEGSNVSDIEISLYNLCAIINEGLFCEGNNYLTKILGPIEQISSDSLVEIFPENSGIKEMRFNDYYGEVTCVRQNDSMKCWGDSQRYLLGISNIIKPHQEVHGNGY